METLIPTMYELQVLYPTDVRLQPTRDYEYEYAIYAYVADNGQSFYTAFLFAEGTLFRVGVSVGTPLGETPETLFAEAGELIEDYIYEILKINLERHN